MPKGVARALEKAISTKDQDIPGTKDEGKFDFLNNNRREIFQYLCNHPCSYASLISKAIPLSLHTTNWHLRRLFEGDYLSREILGKKTVFYPREMISREDIPIFELLNTTKAKAIYLLIAHNNGPYQAEICDLLGYQHQAVIWYATKLESLGLISSLEDGKFKRYYPTQLLSQKKDENLKRMKVFREWIIKRFQLENLSPAIIRTTDDKLVIRIRRGGSKAVLNLNTNPFVTILS
jgi:DNA-binding transcriptional ArsR family regulator